MKNGVLIMPSLVPVNGVIQSITTLDNNCCMQQVTVRNSDGIQNFIISPDTYVINEVRLRVGMNITAFYDADLPIPLIYSTRSIPAQTTPRKIIVIC